MTLSTDGSIRWLGDPIARIVAGQRLLAPRALILTDSELGEEERATVSTRVDLWLAAHLRRQLGTLCDLESAADLKDASRAIVRGVVDSAGIVDRAIVADKVKRLNQDERGALRKFGLRFGAHYVHMPSLLKPAPRALAAQLWALYNGHEGLLGDVLQFAASGRTSFAVDGQPRADLLLAAGFRLCGDRAVRVDIVERIADIIRTDLSSRLSVVIEGSDTPGTGYFVITQAMTSLAGCSAVQFRSILNSLNFESVQGVAAKVAEPDGPGAVSLAGGQPGGTRVDPDPDLQAAAETAEAEAASIATGPDIAIALAASTDAPVVNDVEVPCVQDATMQEFLARSTGGGACP